MPKLPTYTEQELLTLISDGDKTAMRYLFDRFFIKAKFYAVKLINNDTEAEDIVMKVLAKIWEGQRTYASLSHMERSLYVSIHNACINYKEHQKVVKKYEQDYNYIPQATEDDQLVDHLIIRAELTRLLYEEIQQLPTKTREVILLQLTKGLKNAEIAAQLQMDESTVRSHRARAITLLRSALLKRKLYHWSILLSILLKNS